MHISVSGQIFSFPRKCICCGGSPDVEIYVSAHKTQGKKARTRIANTRTKTWSFPCCNACKRHEGMISQAKLLFYGILIFGFLLVFSGLASIQARPVVSGAFAIAGILFVVYAMTGGRKKLCQARALKTSTCTADSPRSLIGYLGWHNNVHTFLINSTPYAFAFMHANRNKLVNVPAKILQQLNAQVQPTPIAPAPVVSLPVPTSPPMMRVSSSTSVQRSTNTEERLSRLAELRDKGIITPDEYETQRRQVVSSV